MYVEFFFFLVRRKRVNVPLTCASHAESRCLSVSVCKDSRQTRRNSMCDHQHLVDHASSPVDLLTSVSLSSYCSPRSHLWIHSSLCDGPKDGYLAKYTVTVCGEEEVAISKGDCNDERKAWRAPWWDSRTIPVHLFLH